MNTLRTGFDSAQPRLAASLSAAEGITSQEINAPRTGFDFAQPRLAGFDSAQPRLAGFDSAQPRLAASLSAVEGSAVEGTTAQNYGLGFTPNPTAYPAIIFLGL
jgi:hypothetical protein